jgi:hypothetical protein
LLRCVEPPEDNFPEERSFTRSTIKFGQWAMTFSLVIFCGVLLAALTETLPGQSGRRPYTAGTVPTTVHNWHLSPIKSVTPTSGQARENRMAYEQQTLFRMAGDELDKEAQTLNEAIESGSIAKVFYIEQDVPFERDYESFAARISVKRDYEVLRGQALLVSSNPEWKRTRAVHLPREEFSNHKLIRVFLIDNPDHDETLRMAVLVRSVDPKKPFPAEMRPEDIGLIIRKEGD